MTSRRKRFSWIALGLIVVGIGGRFFDAFPNVTDMGFATAMIVAGIVAIALVDPGRFFRGNEVDAAEINELKYDFAERQADKARSPEDGAV